MLREKSVNIIPVQGLIPKAISSQWDKIIVVFAPKRAILMCGSHYSSVN
jgi:hypothetical protein